MPILAPLYPDATSVTVTRLRAALVAAGRAVRVAARVPNPRPAELVLVTRTGGPEVMPGVMDGAQITVDAWAADLEDAMDIAQLARKCIHQMPGTAPVHRVVEIGGPQWLPDPTSDSPRVVFTVQIQMRG